jgi:pimeloyl-ACP methyl ester carboxylesterase
MDTPRTWELVLPALEREREVVAITLPGHAGGPPFAGRVDAHTMLDAIEADLDERGLGVVDIAGNSLGGYVALALAARGRARSVVALAPAGGWAPGDDAYAETLDHHHEVIEACRRAAPHADAILSTPEGRRRATEFLTVNYEHIPKDLLVQQLLGVVGATAAPALIDAAREIGWPLDPAQVTCPLRIVWGTADRVLPWPRAAAGYRDSLPQADWIVLDDVGHCPQLDVPAETAALILGFSG